TVGPCGAVSAKTGAGTERSDRRLRRDQVEALERRFGEPGARFVRGEAPSGQDRHVIAHGKRAPEAVGDDDRRTACGLEGVEVLLEALETVLIEPRERLVEQKH